MILSKKKVWEVLNLLIFQRILCRCSKIILVSKVGSNKIFHIFLLHLLAKYVSIEKNIRLHLLRMVKKNYKNKK